MNTLRNWFRDGMCSAFKTLVLIDPTECNLTPVNVEKMLCFKAEVKTRKKSLIKLRDQETSNDITASRLSIELTFAVNTRAELPPVSLFRREFEHSVIQKYQ